jgi:hypothetical protein
LNDLVIPHVSETQGNVHAGAGNQYIFALEDSRGRNPRRQAADELQWLARCFVHPVRFSRAREVLESHRTVFLDASPGSGRIATAKVLLRELRPGSEMIHQLLVQERESGSPLNLSHIGDGDLVWLDLSGPTAWSWSEIQSELSDLRRTVQEHAAHLVLVLPHDTDLQPEFGQYRVRIERPPVHEVLQRHLRMENIVPPPDSVAQLPFLKGHRPLREIPRYVELIRDAKEKASGAGDFAAWCADAQQALSGREREVAGLVAGLSLGPQRALLLATAMLHGAHADNIHRASGSLLATVEHPSDECPVLERAALDQRLEDIHAELDSSGRVRFTELDYDSAVRAYFWAHMPELRDGVRRWVGLTVDSADLSEVDRENLVTRFTEQCLSDRYQLAWVSLVLQCTEQPTTSHRMTAAVLVLQRGLRDEKSSRTFRRQIYEWSRSQITDRLAEVIIVACRDEMMVSHPDEALVRLHHVARRERGTRAREVLVTLVSGDRRFLRQMLSRLTDRSPDAKKWSADVALFLEIADPAVLIDPGTRDHPLVSEGAVRRQLAEGWSLVFASLPPEVWGPRAQEWLMCAADNVRCRNELLDMLIAGGEQRADMLARLYAMTRGQAACAVISRLLLHKISAAQGVQLA